MLRRAIGLFIIFSPFTSYFALSPWVRFPVLLLMLVCVIFFIKLIYTKKIPAGLFLKVNSADIILVTILMLIASSLIFNDIYERGMNHFLAYCFTFIMYFIFLKRIIDFERIEHLYILRMFAISALLCGAIIISDWVLVNFFSIGFREFFVEVDHKIANMLYYQKGYFITVGGVAEEPGSMALLLNIISPLGLLYWKIKKKYSYFMLSLAVYISSLICLFAVAGILSIGIAALIVAVLNLSSANRGLKLKNKTLTIFFFLFIIISISSAILVYKNLEVINDQLGEIEKKLFLSDEDASASLRADYWKQAFANWSESPLVGNGPGDGVKRYGAGYHSVYLTLLADTGIISLFLFLLFILLHFRKIISTNSLYRNYLLLGFFSALVHFGIVGDFYHPPFWILLILIHMIHRSQSYSNVK
jgi:O-antigen ligase